MNARTEAELSAIDTPFDVTDVDAVETKAPVTAVVPVVKNVLEITEVLDAKAKDGETAIATISPLQYDVTGATLAALHKKFAGVTFDVSKPDGRKAAKDAVSEMSKIARGMEDAYKSWNSGIMAMTKHARVQKEKVGEALDMLKKPIVEALDAVKRAEEAAEAKRAAAESARVAAHTKAIAELEALPGSFLTASVATIDAAIAEVSALDYLNFRAWDEYADQARGLQVAAVDTLKTHLTNAQAREALDVERAARAAEDAKRAADAEVTQRITAITTAPMSVFNKPAEDIQQLLNRLNKTDVATFGERAAEATAALTQARTMVEMMLAQAQAAEAKQAELDRLQAEEAKRVADAQAAETAAARAKQAEIDRIAREAREAAEAEDRKQREADQARARELSARRLRMEDHADELLALLTAARAYVTNDGLIAQIDALTKHIEGA
jgi:hypothetical protein